MYPQTFRCKHRYSTLSHSPPLCLSLPPSSLPLSVCFIMCVLSWHFTVLSVPVGISRSAPLSNFPTDCLLSTCLCLPLLSLSLSLLSYMRWYAWITSILSPWPQYSLSTTHISAVCMYAGLLVHTVNPSVCHAFLSASDNEPWSIYYFCWPLQAQTVSLASLDGEESIVLH